MIKLWQEDPETFLNDSALLPLAPLAATTQAEALLQRVAQRVSQLDAGERQEVSGYTQILSGLKFEKDLIRQVFREDMMQESVIYQDILEKGQQKGRQKEGRSLILRQLTRQVGELSEETRSRIEILSLEQLENLGEALLDFEEMADLETWFGNSEGNAPESNDRS